MSFFQILDMVFCIYFSIDSNKSAIYLAGFIGWTRLFCIVPFPWFHRCVYILDTSASKYIHYNNIYCRTNNWNMYLKNCPWFCPSLRITNHQRRYHKRFLILILIMCFPFHSRPRGGKKSGELGSLVNTLMSHTRN